MKKELLLIGLGLMFFGVSLRAQPLDTLKSVPNSVDIEEYNEKGFFRYDALGNPIPRKSVRYSLVVPGMGQAYNKRWWKVPLVAGAIGGIVYLIDTNQSTFRDLRDALQASLDGEEHQFSNTSIDNPTALRSLRDTYDRNTQLSYMGAVAIYGVIAIESFVDAHLQSFDISDDLSMDVQPDFRIDPILRRPTVGMRVSIDIK